MSLRRPCLNFMTAVTPRRSRLRHVASLFLRNPLGLRFPRLRERSRPSGSRGRIRTTRAPSPSGEGVCAIAGSARAWRRGRAGVIRIVCITGSRVPSNAGGHPAGRSTRALSAVERAPLWCLRGSGTVDGRGPHNRGYRHGLDRKQDAGRNTGRVPRPVGGSDARTAELGCATDRYRIRHCRLGCDPQALAAPGRELGGSCQLLGPAHVPLWARPPSICAQFSFTRRRQSGRRRRRLLARLPSTVVLR